MRPGAAAFWLPVGFMISVIDAWLSIQSTAGIMHAINPIAFGMAALVGTALTGFAVYLPTLKADHDSAFLSFLWFVLTVLDIGTSVIGAIWYGMLHYPLIVPVDFSKLRYAPTNWLPTLGYVAFVAIVAWCCTMFGRALVSRRRRG